MNPITGITINRGDRFRIQIWNTSPNATFLQARYVVNPSGLVNPIANEVQYNKVFGEDFDASGNLFQKFLNPPPGELIDFNMNYGNDNVIGGQTYVTIFLENSSGIIITKFYDGYVYPGHGLDYPIRHVEHPYNVPQHGLIKTIDISGLAPAQSVDIDVPNNRAWNILEVKFDVVVAAADSFFSMEYFIGGVLSSLVYSFQLAAMSAWNFAGIVDVPIFPPITVFPASPTAGVIQQNIKIPRNFTLYAPTDFIRISMQQPGDVVQARIITVEEFIKP